MPEERPRHPYVEDNGLPPLIMRWKTSGPLAIPSLPESYTLRTIRPEDREDYESLFSVAWPRKDIFDELLANTLPDGFYVIEHRPSHLLVSSCAAGKPGYYKRYPDVGSLEWLVSDPSHGGRGLATAVVSSVMNRLASEGYEEAYLSTEDERLAAIHIYLKLGWEPVFYTDGMEARWQGIMARLRS